MFVLSVHLFVSSIVYCLKRVHKNAVFSKIKRSRSTVSIDDQ